MIDTYKVAFAFAAKQMSFKSDEMKNVSLVNDYTTTSPHIREK